MNKKLKLTALLFFYILIPFLGYSQSEEFPIDELIGKKSPPDSNNVYYLRAEAFNSFKKMRVAAKEAGIHIAIESGFRSYERQLQIWNSKFNKFKEQGLSDAECVEKILEYSTIPGTSRHHWGTEIDIVIKNAPYKEGKLNQINFDKGGSYHKLKLWMDENSEKYGFKLTYTNDEHRTGFKYEPWHYSYIPISQKMLYSYIEQDCIYKVLDKRILGYDILNEYRLIQYYLDFILLDIKTNSNIKEENSIVETSSSQQKTISENEIIPKDIEVTVKETVVDSSIKTEPKNNSIINKEVVIIENDSIVKNGVKKITKQVTMTDEEIAEIESLNTVNNIVRTLNTTDKGITNTINEEPKVIDNNEMPEKLDSSIIKESETPKQNSNNSLEIIVHTKSPDKLKSELLSFLNKNKLYIDKIEVVNTNQTSIKTKVQSDIDATLKINSEFSNKTNNIDQTYQKENETSVNNVNHDNDEEDKKVIIRLKKT